MSQKFVKVGYGYIGQSNFWEEGTNKPRHYGKITVDGVEIELAGWDRQKDGRAYISLQVSKKEQVPGSDEDPGPALPGPEQTPVTPGLLTGPRQIPDPVVDDNKLPIPGMPPDDDVPF